jgi:GH24 family phage-related lysozyme (muramidase)
VSDLSGRLIDEEEGPSSPLAYHDNLGFITIARGCLIDPRSRGADGLCPAALAAQDAYTLAKAQKLAASLPGFSACNDAQQAVVVSMCFQLGDLHDWPDFRAALEAGDYAECSQQMLFAKPPALLPSSWHKETPQRCERAAYMMRSGIWLNHGDPIP